MRGSAPTARAEPRRLASFPRAPPRSLSQTVGTSRPRSRQGPTGKSLLSPLPMASPPIRPPLRSPTANVRSISLQCSTHACHEGRPRGTSFDGSVSLRIRWVAAGLQAHAVAVKVHQVPHPRYGRGGFYSGWLTSAQQEANLVTTAGRAGKDGRALVGPHQGTFCRLSPASREDQGGLQLRK